MALAAPTDPCAESTENLRWIRKPPASRALAGLGGKGRKKKKKKSPKPCARRVFTNPLRYQPPRPPRPPAALFLRPPPAPSPLARRCSLNFFFGCLFACKKYGTPHRVTKPISAPRTGELQLVLGRRVGGASVCSKILPQSAVDRVQAGGGAWGRGKETRAALAGAEM